MKQAIRNKFAVYTIGVAAMLTFSAAAFAQSQGGFIQLKPPQTPWFFAKYLALNMPGTNPWGYVEVPGDFQRVVIEQVSVSAKATAGTTLRCAFDMANQPGAQFLPFVTMRTSPVNRLGTEVIGTQRILAFLNPGQKGHFRCHAFDGTVDGTVAVTLVGRYE